MRGSSSQPTNFSREVHNFAGMSVDNIIVTGIASGPVPIFSDDFELGGTSAWDGTHP